jgi:hypothetical protein
MVSARHLASARENQLDALILMILSVDVMTKPIKTRAWQAWPV